MSEKRYVLETYALSKKYKDKLAVDCVNMHIEEGDIYGFVGENGAGKTTIIRLITGLANPTSGRYALFGINSADKRIGEARKLMSGIVEAVSVNRSMNALDNLKLQCLINDTKKTDEELINLINRVGLVYNEIAKKKAGDFSLGMRQRLGLAIAMISDPKFIVLDEPMNGLDPQGFIDVRETIIKLNKEGVTFLISSHILSELDKVCNKIGVISHGKLLDEISIDDLHAKSRKKIVIVANEIEDIKDYLVSKLDLKEIEVENETLFIFDDVDINLVMSSLVNGNKLVKDICVKEDTIEDYYINLVVGGKHA
ncbi:MAG: ATP-binding cassette domain-containing protein [Bacilli bacterium]|nr:ATP-binding cassette domain-containing protein [Bacilli bacterium]